MKPKKANTNLFRAVGRSVPLVVKASPLFCAMYVGAALMMAVAFGIAAPVSQILYDALADLLDDGAMRYVYIGIAFMLGVALFQQLANEVLNFVWNATYEKLNGAMAKDIHAKMARIPAAFFEDKENLDNIEKVNEGKQGAIQMYIGLNYILFNIVGYLVIMGIYLWSLRPLLIVSMVLAFVPELFSQIVQAKIMAKLEDTQAPNRRKNSHYEECITGGDKLKETRLFGAFYFFKSLFMDSLKLLTTNELKTQRKMETINLGMNLVKAAGWTGTTVLLLLSLMNGHIGVGAFAAVFTSVGMMFGMMTNAMWQFKQNVSENLGKINNLINILDVPTPELAKNIPDFSHPLVVDNVSFYYPQAEKPAVHGVSLTIRPGETIALVGENGSGKTTLSMMLCGLFKPTTGTVTIGGCNTATTDEECLFSKTSAIFQWTQSYAFDLSGNITISDVTSEKDPRDVIPHAGIDPTDQSTYPKGMETMLLREFEGVQLSGGQWQRIGVARGLYRHHEFIIMDEPTSAIDPLEEARMYKRFTDLARGKMAVLVTHRLGSVKIADKIIVMDGGTIVETGTHDDLLAANGKYAEMWAAQAEGYQEETA